MCIETVTVLGHASAVIAVYTYSGKLFEGENFRANFESFLREIWGRRVLWRGKSEQSAKVLSAKIVFIIKFSPSKVSRYTVFQRMAKYMYIVQIQDYRMSTRAYEPRPYVAYSTSNTRRSDQIRD